MVVIRLLTEKDFECYIDNILELYRLCFTAPVTQKDFIWRYLQNPYKDVNAVIALKDGIVVGFIGASSNRMIVKKREIKVAMIMNMMTHPNYIRQGIFSRMLHALERKLKDKKYEFIYSFPNYHSNHILIDQHEWTDIYEIPRLELSKEQSMNLNLDQNDSINLDNMLEMEYDVRYSNEFSKKFVHSLIYRKWRINENPVGIYDNFVVQGKSGKVSGYITVRRYMDEYNIVDFMFETMEQAKQLLFEAIKTFQALDYRIMTAWCPTNTSLHSMYEKLGFINKYPITYFAGKSIGERCNYNNELTNWDGWYLHAIDNNIY